MPERTTKTVGALVSGLRILRHLSARRSGAGVTVIARDLDLNPSTCFNLLRTLVQERLLVFDEGTKTYRPGLGLIELAKGSLEPISYARLARPELERLAARHGVTASLWQRSGSDRVVLVDYADSAAAIRLHMSIGQRLPWSIGALGRCFMAHAGLSKAEMRAHFKAVRWQDPPPFEQFVSDVEHAKRDGFAVDHGNYVRGVTTISAIVTDTSNSPVMAISAVAFSAQLDDPSTLRIAHDVRGSAADISSILLAEPAEPRVPTTLTATQAADRAKQPRRRSRA